MREGLGDGIVVDLTLVDCDRAGREALGIDVMVVLSAMLGYQPLGGLISLVRPVTMLVVVVASLAVTAQHTDANAATNAMRIKRAPLCDSAAIQRNLRITEDRR